MNFGGIRKFELGGRSMENDYSSFITRGDDGAVTSFDETKFSSYLDSQISKAVNTGIEGYKAKTAKEAEMAKMTADEQLNARIKEFETKQAEWESSMKSQKRDIVIEKAKAKLGTDFSDEEINLFTQNVTDDEKTSMKMIETLVAERKKFIEESRKKLLEELQKKQPPATTDSNSDGKSNNPPVKKDRQDILNQYK